MLYRHGHKKTAVLLEGIERLVLTDRQEMPGLENYYKSTAPFGTLSSADFERYAVSHPQLLSLDVRTTEEYNNKHADYWRNIGHLVNAINIPVKNLATGLVTLDKYKNTPVVVYAFSGNPDAFEAAYLLTKNGFTDVQVLAGGIFNIRWTAANSPGHAALAKWVTDVPESNR
jgi:3-mercaptopyruvate sulfurtransferase SseA